MRILLQELGDGGLEGIQFARALTGSGGLRRRDEIFGDGSAPDVQMTGDLAHWPVLGPVQAMNFVDLFGAQHGLEFGYTDRPARMPEGCSFQARVEAEVLLPNCSKIKTCVEAKLFFSRLATLGPTIQTSAAERFRSKAKLFFSSRRMRRFWSRLCWRSRFRSPAS